MKLALVVLAALVAGAMNSIAGGGTLITFPALIALGVPPIVANATSTMALWPGSFGSMWGYRTQLRGLARWSLAFAVPSLLGGATGALLLLSTPAETFSDLVPWLVLGATFLFMAQRPITRWLERRRSRRNAESPGDDPDTALTVRRPPPAILVYQYLIGVYGGYFGAGVGILMLAALGLMGLTNIHRMNGLKNWGGLCMNATAALLFGFSSLVNWPVALAMAVGAVSGGYLGAHGAQRVPQGLVRATIVAIGLVSGLLLLLNG
jgi:uncharacterized membrane protein YfcA